MLIKTYSLRPHCVSCWTAYVLQDDTRSLQCQVVRQVYLKRNCALLLSLSTPFALGKGRRVVRPYYLKFLRYTAS